jgi:hypothetical protein
MTEWERHERRKQKTEHMLSLENEVRVLSKRVRPSATGRIIITIGVLNERVKELKLEMIRDGDRKRLTEKIWAAVGDDQLRKDDPNHVKHDQSYWRDD